MTKKIILIGIFSSIAFIVAIFSSRGSTASIGLVFLPFVVAIPVTLAMISHHLKNKYSVLFVNALIACFLLYQVKMIFDVKIKKNKADEEARLAAKNQVEIERKFKNEFLNLSPLEVNGKISKLFKSNLSRVEILVLLSNEQCPVDILSEYSKSEDSGYVFTVARNKMTSPDILRSIFLNSKYAFYYYSELSANPHTPADVLVKLFELREKNNLIPLNLFNNPNTPKYIKALLSK